MQRRRGLLVNDQHDKKATPVPTVPHFTFLLMPFTIDNDFRKRAIDAIMEILTSTGSIRPQQTNENEMQSPPTHSSFLAPSKEIYRRFRRDYAPPHLLQDPKTKQRLNEFIKGNEFDYYIQTIRQLLQIPPVHLAPLAIIKSKRLENKTPQLVLQEWYNENEERVQEMRLAILDIVRTAVSVVWDMHRVAFDNEETRVQRFRDNDDIRELYESSRDNLFSSILADREIDAIFLGVSSWKEQCGNGAESALLKHMVLNEERTRDLWKMVMNSNEYRSVGDAQHTSQDRQGQVLRERPEQVNRRLESENEKAIETDVINGIQTSACLERICKELLQENLYNERVCEVALERLLELIKGGFIGVDAVIDARVAKPILKSMTEHATNQRIQKCGVMLLRRTQVRLSEFLGQRLYARATFAVCTAITNVPDDANLQRHGLGLICTLEGNTESLDDFYSNLVEFGALAFVRRALLIHQDEYDIVKCALQLLGNILEDNDGEVTDNEIIIDFICRDPGDIQKVVADVYKYQKQQAKDRARQELKPLVVRARGFAKRIQRETQQ